MYNAQANNPAAMAVMPAVMEQWMLQTAPFTPFKATGKSVLCALVFDVDQWVRVVDPEIGSGNDTNDTANHRVRTVNVDDGYRRELPIDP